MNTEEANVFFIGPIKTYELVLKWLRFLYNIQLVH